VENMFKLFDLTGKGKITKTSCKEALKIIASSQMQTEKINNAEIPELVDLG
jgi:Ca2+-binding EF-hand superfamily protein